MKHATDIDTRLPYRESDDYVNHLIERCTSNAIEQHHHQPQRMVPLWIISAAASAVLLLTAGITWWHLQRPATITETEQGPLDRFLDNLSDEDASYITYYEMEEIPTEIYN
ncbi:MAG: hypothetical protein J6I72_08815 [Muribaculaceae bacterium]|nr:hypothetical protein [Muribaculaceae bacterium]